MTTNERSLSSKRTKCEVYTRVMGYLRPVSQYNIGKKAEFYSRQYFDEHVSKNSRFVQKYEKKYT